MARSAGEPEGSMATEHRGLGEPEGSMATDVAPGNARRPPRRSIVIMMPWWRLRRAWVGISLGR
jgi:hypothetical protein